MPSRHLVLLFLGLVLVLPAAARQKRALDHADYPKWMSVSDESLSRDGAWVAWREAPDEVGNGRVLVKRVASDTRHTILRGDNPRFAGSHVVALVHPPYDSTRQARIKGKKGDDLPKDSVAVLNLRSGTLTFFGPASGFKVPEKSGAHAAILLDRTTATTRDSSRAASPHEKKDGKDLLLVDLQAGDTTRFGSVLDYGFTDNGKWLYYTAQTKSGTGDGVYAVSTADHEVVAVLAGEGFYDGLAFDKAGAQVAFTSNTTDFAADQPSFSVYVAPVGEPAEPAVREGSAGVPEGWWISEHASLEFSDSGARLYFGTVPRPAPEVKDERPDNEKVSVDIWNWTDRDLMTMQLVNRERDSKQSFRAVLHVASGTVVQLADQEIPAVNVGLDGDGPVVFGLTDLPYLPEGSWDTPGRSDVYTIQVETGRRKRILEGIRSGIQPSPDGRHLAWWDGEHAVWKITGWTLEPSVITTATVAPPDGIRFDDELHDSPSIPGSYGQAGWTPDGDRFVIYDRHDLWAASPAGGVEPVTDGQGRRAGLRYRLIRLDREVQTVDLAAPQLLSVFDLATRSSGFSRLEGATRRVTPLLMEPRRFGTPEKARDADRLLLTRESYHEFPDLWVTGPAFANWERISQANPQQSSYRWGSVELVSWTSTDGDRLEGLLYKPEGFDPARKYPMMVYFYERSSDGLHSYHAPAPGRSTINRTFYASRGYLVFVPDIPYKEGYPGESAMNAVMPGVTGLLDQGFVDPGRVGVQGHSWGGYQIAYMVTRTNLFRAAEAGAPVANMISAYGGIRWQSGMSRMFQYERTQSRIGGSLWDKPLRYIENSPIFWLDKVETPLLIMHNDADGAVPWYQGIELFTAMRRLGKPAWLLNYNGEPHWPLPYFKRLDFTTRMQQYFDHYLMDAAAPVWMTEGVPAIQKGETWGLEIAEPADH